MSAVIRRLRRRVATDERGMSLVELLVYSVLLSVVLLIIGSLLVQTLVTQRDVRGRTEASNETQVAFTAVERSVRNGGGAAIRLGGDLLVVRERIAKDANDADHWRCVGYYVDDANGVVRRVEDRTGTMRTKQALDSGNPRALAATWPVLISEAGTIGATPAFAPVDTTVAAGGIVKIGLRAQAGPESKPVELRSSVALRPQGGSALACW